MSINYEKIAEELNLTEKEVKSIENETFNLIIDLMRSDLYKIKVHGLGNFIPLPNKVANTLCAKIKKFRTLKDNNLPYSDEDLIQFRQLWDYRKEDLIQVLNDTRRNPKKNPWFKRQCS